MSVQSVTLISTGVSGTATGAGPLSIRTSYRASYRVQVSSKLDTPDIVLAYFRANAGLPWPGRPYRFANGFDATSLCKSLTPDRVEKSDCTYIVSVDFQPQDDEQDEGKDENGNKTDNPLLFHDEIEVSYTQLTIPCYEATYIEGMKGRAHALRRANTKGPIINSAGVPFDPTLETEAHIRIVRFTKNVERCNADINDALQGKVNDNEVVIRKDAYQFFDRWPKYHALIKNFSHRFMFTNNIKHWQRNIEVWVNPLGWREQILDQGVQRRQLDGDKNDQGVEISASDLEPQQPRIALMKDAEGYPVTSPQLLDGDGQPLEPGRPAVFLTYAKIPEISFPLLIW